MRPVIPIVARRLKQPLEFGGYRLPPEITIIPCIHLAHHDASAHPEPEAFRPERFMEGQPDPQAWIPWGGGVRRCVGDRFATLEMRTVLATALRRTDLRATRPAPAPIHFRGFHFTPRGGTRVVADAVR